MKYVHTFLALLVLNISVSCAVYSFFPSFRYFFLTEDSLIENLSASFFLLAGFLAVLAIHKNKFNKNFLVFVSFLGILGFLDELSFGQRHLGLTMPMFFNTEIHAVHDLVQVTYNILKTQVGSQGMGYILSGSITGLILLTFVFRGKLKDQVKIIFLEPHYTILVIMAVLLSLALLIDLHIIRYTPLYMIEELLEMHVAIGLCFLSFCPPHDVQTQRPDRWAYAYCTPKPEMLVVASAQEAVDPIVTAQEIDTPHIPG